MFPLFKLGLISDIIAIFSAIVIGIAFGFFLEQAGLGNARKLVAQFYLKDLTVYKVMFSAIITAMIGIYYFTLAGWLDFSLIAFSDTWYLPQVAGGLLLGFGFIVGGYCPGTCLIGIAGQKKDAAFFLGGILIGMLVYGESYPMIETFHSSTHVSKNFLPDLFGLNYGTTVFIVAVLALASFWFAEWIESRNN